MLPRNPMDRPMPQVPQGPMTIPNPQSGPVSTGPFGSPYDPQSPNTPNLPTNQMPRPPVRNPLDTGVDYEPPGPTQIPKPGDRGPQNDPFNRDHRGLDGKFPTMPQASMSQGRPSSLQGLRAQAQGQNDMPTTAAQNKFLRDKHGAVGNERLGQLRSQYQQSLQPTEADKQFMMSQGNRRNPGSMDTSLLQKPQQTRKPTGPTTVNVRQPNKGWQQLTAGQNRALGNTMQTSSSNASAMRNAASRYKRAGLRTTANRAKPRTSLPQLYGN